MEFVQKSILLSLQSLKDFFFIGPEIHSREYREVVNNEDRVNDIIKEIESEQEIANQETPQKAKAEIE